MRVEWSDRCDKERERGPATMCGKLRKVKECGGDFGEARRGRDHSKRREGESETRSKRDKRLGRAAERERERGNSGSWDAGQFSEDKSVQQQRKAAEEQQPRVVRISGNVENSESCR